MAHTPTQSVIISAAVVLNKEREAPPLQLINEAAPVPATPFVTEIKEASGEVQLQLFDEDPAHAMGESLPRQLGPALTRGTVVDQLTADQHDCIIPISDEIVEENATTTGGGVTVNGGADWHRAAEAAGAAAAGGQKVPMCHEVMQYMIPSLMVLATLMYQGKSGALLAENPVAVSSFLVSYCAYWLTVRMMKHMPSESSETKRFRIVNQMALVCGLVSGASPLFILFINHHKLPLLHHLFWMLLAVGYLWLLLFCAYVYLCVGDTIQEGAGGLPPN